MFKELNKEKPTSYSKFVLRDRTPKVKGRIFARTQMVRFYLRE